MKKYAWAVAWLCAAVYFISYLTRINYGAVILAIVENRGITNAAASMALTGSAITYGFGQLLSGFMGDRVKPTILIFAGIITTMITNILLPLTENVYLMTGIWCVNGLAQAFMWPPMVKYMTNLLNMHEYQRGAMMVSQAASAGTIAVYLLASLCVNTLGWEAVFYIAATAAGIMAVMWITASRWLEKNAPIREEHKVKKEDVTVEKVRLGGIFYAIIVGTIFAIAMQGLLRDGITTWMPTYLENTYHLGSSVSILSSIILPIFSAVSIQVIGWIYRKWIKNEEGGSAGVFALSAVFALLLWKMSDFNAVVSIVLTALIIGCMHAINFMLITMMPIKLKKFGNVSFMTGLLNSATYIGSAVSGYGMALIADNFGWNTTIFCWGIVALLGMTACLVMRRPWGNLLKK